MFPGPGRGRLTVLETETVSKTDRNPCLRGACRLAVGGTQTKRGPRTSAGGEVGAVAATEPGTEAGSAQAWAGWATVGQGGRSWEATSERRAEGDETVAYAGNSKAQPRPEEQEVQRP